MAQDRTTLCVNGELKPGDLVISAPQDSYTGLVGTVLSVNKAGTPEHDEETDNPGDDVHVDFTAFEYSDRRIGEIEDMFSLLYDEKKNFEECPIDDVIMSPDMLIRITGIEREELAETLDSEEKAVAYCERVFADQEQTFKSGYTLAADEHETVPESQSKSGISTGKPSVMDQIRRARLDAKENPAPHKESPAKDKGQEI